MIKEKLEWDIKLKIISLALTSFFFILTIISIITKQDIAVIIVIGILNLLGLVLSIYLLVYKICVYEDKIKLVSIFKIKEYYYNSIILKSDVSIMISDINGKELLRIASFLDPKSIIRKWYNSYCKKNNLKYNLINKKMKYNFYVKNFSIFGCAFSVVIFAMFLLSLYVEKKGLLNNTSIPYFFLIFSIVIFLPSIYSLILYFSFEIIWSDDILIFKNFIGIKKEYKNNTLKCEYTDKLIKISFPNKRKKILLYYFLDNRDMLLFAINNVK